MTFLELCQRLREESGITGDEGTPVSVLNQRGEFRKVVKWIADAYQFVQNKHPDWDFLRFEFSFPTIIGTSTYTPGSVGLPELAKWKVDTFRYYLTSAGVASEQDMDFVQWYYFRDVYLRGSLVTQPGPPQKFTMRPDKSIQTSPVSDALYTVTGEYWKRAQVMAVNADEPLFPEEFHLVLMWKGLMSYAAAEGAPELYAQGQEEFGRLMGKLERDQRPLIGMAGALA